MLRKLKKIILDPYPHADQHQKLITSRGSRTLAHAYHVWSTSVNTFVSYSAHRHNELMTDRQTERTIT